MTYVIKKDKSDEPRKNKTTRFSKKELIEAQNKANVYTNGCVSKWIRYAALHCIPFSQDMEKK